MGYGPEYQKFGAFDPTTIGMTQGAPSGLAAFLARPGLRDALLAAGSSLLSQRDQPGSLGGALGRALPVGMQAYQQGQQNSQTDALIAQLPPQMQALFKTLSPDQRGPALMQMITKPPQALTEVGPNGVLVGADGKAVFRNTVADKATPLEPDAALKTAFVEYGVASPDQYNTLPVGVKKVIDARADEIRRVTSPKESPTAKGNDEYLLKQFNDIRSAADAAGPANAKLDVMQGLLEKGMKTGALASATLPARQMAVDMGLVDPNAQVSDQQLFQSLSNGMIGQARQETGISRLVASEIPILMKTIPNLQNTPEGNLQLIKIARTLNQLKVDAATEARSYYKSHGNSVDGLDEHMAQWQDQHKADLHNVITAGNPYMDLVPQR